MYLLEVGTLPLLSKEEEQRLGRAIQRGRDAAAELARPHRDCQEEGQLQALVDEAREAVQELIRSNLPLVVFVAKNYRSSGLPLLDLIQEGNLGLIRAAQKFDIRRGVRFSTHGTWWIRQAIQVAVARDTRAIRLPQRLFQQLSQLYGVENRLQGELGRPATPEEIGRELGLDMDDVRKLRSLPGQPRSLNECVGADETRLEDLVVDPARSPDAIASVTADLATLLSVLDDREREILTLRFGLDNRQPCTFKELGKALGLTPERVRQIHVGAIAKLSKAAGP